MIIDKTYNMSQYAALLPNLENGLNAVRALGPHPEVTPRTPFEGGFFFVQRGELKPISDGDYEAHEKYIDVQIILEGCEYIAWDNIKDLSLSEAYNPEKDRAMYAGAVSHVVRIDAGMAWAAFPSDGHKACKTTGENGSFLKVVMKLKIED